MANATVRGECSCGKVRFEADLPTRFVAHCHCNNCRRAHGAGVVTWAGFRAEHVRVTAGLDDLSRYHTETGATRSFCGACGSPLFFHSPRWAGEIHIAVANLLDPLDSLPGSHAYADRAPDWCPITDGLPRFGGETGTEKLEG